MKMPKSMLVECDDTLYIQAKYAGMHFLCLLVDGIPLTFFGKKGKQAYLTIQQAIEWHRRECEANPAWDESLLSNLLKIQEKYASQKMADSPKEPA